MNREQAHSDNQRCERRATHGKRRLFFQCQVSPMVICLRRSLRDTVSRTTALTSGSLSSRSLAMSSSDGNPPAVTSEASVKVQYDSLLLFGAGIVVVFDGLLCSLLCWEQRERPRERKRQRDGASRGGGGWVKATPQKKHERYGSQCQSSCLSSCCCVTFHRVVFASCCCPVLVVRCEGTSSSVVVLPPCRTDVRTGKGFSR